MKGGAAVQQIILIDKIQILLNKIFAFSNIAESKGQGICSNIFIRQQDIIEKLVILQRMKVNDEIFVMGLFLVDRLTTKNKFYLVRRNIYNLLMTAIILSLKMYDDNQIVQHIYPIIFETNREILNKMEKKFLKLIQYQLYVKTEDFFNYRARLLKLNDRCFAQLMKNSIQKYKLYNIQIIYSFNYFSIQYQYAYLRQTFMFNVSLLMAIYLLCELQLTPSNGTLCIFQLFKKNIPYQSLISSTSLSSCIDNQIVQCFKEVLQFRQVSYPDQSYKLQTIGFNC